MLDTPCLETLQADHAVNTIQERATVLELLSFMHDLPSCCGKNISCCRKTAIFFEVNVPDSKCTFHLRICGNGHNFTELNSTAFCFLNLCFDCKIVYFKTFSIWPVKCVPFFAGSTSDYKRALACPLLRFIPKTNVFRLNVVNVGSALKVSR